MLIYPNSSCNNYPPPPVAEYPGTPSNSDSPSIRPGIPLPGVPGQMISHVRGAWVDGKSGYFGVPGFSATEGDWGGSCDILGQSELHVLCCTWRFCYRADGKSWDIPGLYHLWCTGVL